MSCGRACSCPNTCASIATAMSAREGRGIIVKKVSAPAVRVGSCFCHAVKVAFIRSVNSCLFTETQVFSDHHFHRSVHAVDSQGVCLCHVLQKHGSCLCAYGCN